MQIPTEEDRLDGIACRLNGLHEYKGNINPQIVRWLANFLDVGAKDMILV